MFYPLVSPCDQGPRPDTRRVESANKDLELNWQSTGHDDRGREIELSHL